MDLESWLEQRFGVPVRSVRSVGGGSIHRALRVSRSDGSQLFVKTAAAAALPLLSAEAEGLAALAAAAAEDLRVPEVLACAAVGSRAVLVLPWLALGSTGDWARLGCGLAQLHRRSLGRPLVAGDQPARFGWPSDNWIGATPQRNGWASSWAAFLVEQRLAPQLQGLRGVLNGSALAAGEHLLERVPAWLADHQPEPCLVHGDLWAGNAGVLSDGSGAIFDPAVHRADREVDLAMARLFGGFPESFFRGYGVTWPLPSGHQLRLPLYNLYHLLNHATLFGGGYVGQSTRLITELLATHG